MVLNARNMSAATVTVYNQVEVIKVAKCPDRRGIPGTGCFAFDG